MIEYAVSLIGSVDVVVLVPIRNPNCIIEAMANSVMFNISHLKTLLPSNGIKRVQAKLKTCGPMN